jgi:hypothetical protein
MTSGEEDNFEPLVVLELSSSTPAATKEWVIRRLTDDHMKDDGAGLLVRLETEPENRVRIFLSRVSKCYLSF